MFELNFECVEQGKKELREARLFSAPQVKNNEFAVCNDFEKAKNSAFFRETYVYRNKKGYTWSDIKELEMAVILETVYNQENYKEINEMIRKITIGKDDFQVVGKEYYDIWDQVDGLIIECLRTRAILGITDNLYEKMFQAFLSGGWPCGWQGKYPEGKLIVYYPKE